MRQQTLAPQAGFERYARKTRREQFLEEMERVVPWAELEQLVRPHYPKGVNGRPPVGLSLMLRIYFHMLADLLHGEERKAWGDGGYQGRAKPSAVLLHTRRT